MSLELRVAIRILLMLVLSLVVILVPAGTWQYWQGWVFLPAFFLPGMLIFVYFLRHDRALFERRMRTRKTVKERRRLMCVFALLFLASFLLPGFDHRLGWSRRLVGEVPLSVSVWVTAISLALLVTSGFFRLLGYEGESLRRAHHPSG